MVWQFIEVFKKIGGEHTHDDDFADRLSHRYTVVLLLIFCILVGSSQFVGNPIQCWAPAHFSGSMTAYTNNICWIANTYSSIDGIFILFTVGHMACFVETG